MRRKLTTLLALSLLLFSFDISAETLSLYVDKKTKQVFTEPGANREKMNVQMLIVEPGSVPVSGSAAGSPSAGSPTGLAGSTIPAPASSQTEVTSVSLSPNAAPKSGNVDKMWYEKLSIRGYTQLRTTILDDKDETKVFHPADRSVAPDQSFIIRRARVILSGDVNEHMFIYVQPDLNASSVDGSSAQLRDLYSDIALDSKKEFRIRAGQSKVPFGFVNLQSSQNRLGIERPDAINSAAEGERDVGAFFYWAPEEIRKRFQLLVKDGLKGSGDYGVLGIGAYNGQGLNRSDQNDNQHVIARASYPFKFSNGQYFEPGIQAYGGNFVPTTQEIFIGDSEEGVTPTFDKGGVQDQRIGLTAVLYPQPIGFEAEWNVGKGPQLSDDFSTIESKSLNGGYFLVNAKIDTPKATFFPFIRWQYFDGGRKFGRNSPSSSVNEWDFGIEYSPYPDVELTAMYTFTNYRTNTNDAPYDDFENESRLALQLQVNY